MLRQITPFGTFETSDPATVRQMLDSANEAEQKALTKVYSVTTLAERLGLSVRRTYDLLTNGKIRYACLGLKNYRVSEQAVREYLGDLRAAA